MSTSVLSIPNQGFTQHAWRLPISPHFILDFHIILRVLYLVLVYAYVLCIINYDDVVFRMSCVSCVVVLFFLLFFSLVKS